MKDAAKDFDFTLGEPEPEPEPPPSRNHHTARRTGPRR